MNKLILILAWIVSSSAFGLTIKHLEGDAALGPESAFARLSLAPGQYEKSEIPQYSSQHHWFLIPIVGEEFVGGRKALHFTNPIMGEISAWYVFADGTTKSIDHLKINHHYPVYELNFEAGRPAYVMLRCFFPDVTEFSVRVKDVHLSAYEGLLNFASLCMLMMGIACGLVIYNLCLNIFYKDSKLNYFAIYCISSITISTLLMGMLQVLGFSYQINYYGPILGTLAVGLSVRFSMAYLATLSYAPRFTKFVLALLISNFIVALVVTFGGPRELQYICDLIYVVMSLCHVLLVVIGVKHKIKSSALYLVSWIFPFAGLVTGTLVTYDVVERNVLTECANMVCLSLQIMYLSIGVGFETNMVRKKMMESLAKANSDLERLVSEKTAKIWDYYKNIKTIMTKAPVGIMSVDSTLKVGSEYSQFLEQLVDKSDLAGKDVMELIFSESNSTGDDIASMRSALQFSYGSDEINFNINEHLLIKSSNIKDKIVHLSWTPIADENGEVQRVLLLAYDVTQEKMLEAAMSRQAYEDTLMVEVAATRPNVFLGFLDSCESFCSQNNHLLENARKSNFQQILKILLINCHTMKGAARSLNLTIFKNILHDAETELCLIRDDIDTLDLSKVSATQATINTTVVNYRRIAIDRLRFKDGENRFVHVDRELAINIVDAMEQLQMHKQVQLKDLQEMGRLIDIVKQDLYKTLRTTLQSIFASVDSLARDLQKPVPHVHIECDDIYLTSDTEDMVRSVFVHLIRNSLDHGIEHAEERCKIGKTPNANIYIKVQITDDRLIFQFSDDGKGLDMEKLYTIAVSIGVISDHVMPTNQQIAETIFTDGLSTSTSVNDISGRGVGMPSVKEFVEQRGGHLEIVLAEAAGNTNPFTLNIVLPLELFNIPGRNMASRISGFISSHDVISSFEDQPYQKKAEGEEHQRHSHAHPDIDI